MPDLVIAVESMKDDSRNGAELLKQMLVGIDPKLEVSVRSAFAAVNSADGPDCKYMFCGPKALKSQFEGAHCPPLKEMRRTISQTGFGQYYSATYRAHLAMALSWRAILMQDCMWLLDKAGKQHTPTFNHAEMQKCDMVGWDLETDGEFWSPHGQILTVALCDGSNVAGNYMPHQAKFVYLPDGVTLAGHGIKYDLCWWEEKIGKITNPLFCTEIAEALLNDNITDNSLGFLSTRHTNMPYFKDMVNRAKLAHEDKVKVLLYNEYDAYSSVMVARQQREALRERGLEPVFNFMMDLVPVFADIERTGVYIDTEWAYARGREIQRLNEDAIEMTRLSPEVLKSTKQLGEYLYKELRLPIVKRTKGGAPSVDSDALEEVYERTEHPVVQAILDHRKYEKLDGTYYRPIPNWIRHDGRVHTNYSLCSGEFGGTTTGRTASRNPNLQNIPKSKMDRGMFCATPGWKWADADYSQLELRVVADLSGDTAMLRAFSEGFDIHTDGMSGLCEHSYEEIARRLDEGDEEMQHLRRGTKCISFGILYGAGAGTICRLVKKAGGSIDYRVSQQRIDRWFQRYSGVKHWMDKTEQFVIDNGYVEMPSGRRRTLLDAERGTPAGLRALRQACNAPVQGTASDITLTAMYLLDQYFKEHGGARLLLNVHDQVGLEFDPEVWDDMGIYAALETIMVKQVPAEFERRFGYKLTVPLAIDPKVGERWS